MSEKIKYTFPSGLEVNGSLPELEKIAASLGEKLDYIKIGIIPRGYYPSTSKGLIRISEMNDFHLRRALLKVTTEKVAAVYKPTDSNLEFLKKFLEVTDDNLIEDLFEELRNRE